MTGDTPLPNKIWQSEWARNVLALVIGVVGYLVADALHFPAPALTGPALFTSVASLSGLKIEIHPRFCNIIFMLIGIATGTSVTPDVLEAARLWPESFLLLSVGIVVIFLLCRYMLQRVWGLDRETSTLASTPGHMSYVLGLTMESKADLATVSVVQSIRVLALTLIVPLIITLLGYEPVALASSGKQLPVLELVVILGLSFLCALCFQRIRLAAAYLLAGMFVSTLIFITGTVEGVMPQTIYLPTIVIMGTIIGTRISGVSFKLFISAAGSGLALMMVAVLLSALMASFYAWWSGLPFGQLLIAFAPGGLETMIAMSLLLDADPAYVAAHHVWRLIILTFLAPLMLATPRFGKQKGPDG